MAFDLLSTAEFLVRWFHVLAAMVWIGTSFYFIHLEATLRRRSGMSEAIKGESWQVHGGGFYHMRKYRLAPDDLPADIHWFKYESYFTWLSGFALLALIYYAKADVFLLPEDGPLSSARGAILASLCALAAGWLIYDGLCRLTAPFPSMVLWTILLIFVVAASAVFKWSFDDRAAFLHVGALIATWMTGNVFFIIIPNQKKSVAALVAGNAPDPVWGEQSLQRSTHNNYLTPTVLAMMLSVHYPALYGHAYLPAATALIFIAGALGRHFFNLRRSGAPPRFFIAAAAGSVAALVVLAGLISHRPEIRADDAVVAAATAERATAIMATRCASCHAAAPTYEGFSEPPGGLIFDDVDAIRRHAASVYEQTVAGDAMPPGNVTGMTDEERAILGRWLRSGAP